MTSTKSLKLTAITPLAHRLKVGFETVTAAAAAANIRPIGKASMQGGPTTMYDEAELEQAVHAYVERRAAAKKLKQAGVRDDVLIKLDEIQKAINTLSNMVIEQSARLAPATKEAA